MIKAKYLQELMYQKPAQQSQTSLAQSIAGVGEQGSVGGGAMGVATNVKSIRNQSPIYMHNSKQIYQQI